MISIIIPTRNRLGFLKEAVASVSAQDYPDRETIIVDDASEDGTWGWLSSPRDPQTKSFRLPQHGERSAARNFGLAQAKGDFVMFLDDDDLLVPHALTYLCAAAKRYPAAMAVVGNRLFFDQTGRRYEYPHPRRTVVRRVWADLLFGWIPQVSQCIIRRSAVVEAGGWNPLFRFAEDHELWMRMMSSESLVVVLPRIVAEYRVHPGQTPGERRCRGYQGFLQAAIRRLPATLQGPATRIVRARWLSYDASIAFAQRHYGTASRLYAAAILKAPRLLLSPLVRERLVRGLAKSLLSGILGSSAAALMRRTKSLYGRLALGHAGRRNAA
jgi:glycosyltransferase involved in cell wall biosynthesis